MSWWVNFSQKSEQPPCSLATESFSCSLSHLHKPWDLHPVQSEIVYSFLCWCRKYLFFLLFPIVVWKFFWWTELTLFLLMLLCLLSFWPSSFEVSKWCEYVVFDELKRQGNYWGRWGVTYYVQEWKGKGNHCDRYIPHVQTHSPLHTVLCCAGHNHIPWSNCSLEIRI